MFYPSSFPTKILYTIHYTSYIYRLICVTPLNSESFVPDYSWDRTRWRL